MNHKFNQRTILKEVKEFLESAGAKEVTRILFDGEEVVVSFN